MKTRDDLSMAYTPGVARVCLAIADDPDQGPRLTIKQNTVAVVTDGTAVLGPGRHRPRGGDAGDGGQGHALQGVRRHRRLADRAWTPRTPTRSSPSSRRSRPAFGGINLEDIAAPRCFEIEGRLRRELDIPVFHDDQHGTAVVVLAALLNAAKLVGKRIDELKVVVIGVGAAGVAVSKLLMEAGVTDIIGCDREGALYRRQARADRRSRSGTPSTPTRTGSHGDADEALAGADVFLGLSGPGAVSVDAITSMAPDAIVFAMANPTPEVPPEELEGIARVIATGRSDYPNQINNVLAFPGIFRGALDSRRRRSTRR